MNRDLSPAYPRTSTAPRANAGTFWQAPMWPSLFAQLGVWEDREASLRGPEACGTPIRALARWAGLAYARLGSDCGPYVDPPRLVTGLRGSPLVVLLPVGQKKAPADVWRRSEPCAEARRCFCRTSARYVLPSRHAAYTTHRRLQECESSRRGEKRALFTAYERAPQTASRLQKPFASLPRQAKCRNRGPRQLTAKKNT